MEVDDLFDIYVVLIMYSECSYNALSCFSFPDSLDMYDFNDNSLQRSNLAEMELLYFMSLLGICYRQESFLSPLRAYNFL